MAQSQLVFICLVFATSAFGIQKRGVVEEVGNIFESFTNGFTNSFDQIHKAAREEVSRLQVSLIDNTYHMYKQYSMKKIWEMK